MTRSVPQSLLSLVAALIVGGLALCAAVPVLPVV